MLADGALYLCADDFFGGPGPPLILKKSGVVLLDRPRRGVANAVEGCQRELGGTHLVDEIVHFLVQGFHEFLLPRRAAKIQSRLDEGRNGIDVGLDQGAVFGRLGSAETLLHALALFGKARAPTLVRRPLQLAH